MKAKTGFALMTPERRRELGAQGGRLSTGHRFTAEESRKHASAAGVKSGEVRREKGGHGKGGRKFTSDAGRLAAEKKHDLAAKGDVGVTWEKESQDSSGDLP